MNAVVDYIANFTWVTGETPMTSVPFLVGVHVVYASLLLALTAYMKNRESISWVPTFGFYHNMFMSLLSFAMLVGLVVGAAADRRFESLEAFACVRPLGRSVGLVPFSMYLFYLSKMCEFVDTFMLVANKKKLIWLHKVHHLTTMSLVWHAMVADFSIDLIAAGSNCAVHVLMYAYFARPVRALRSTITTSQIAQFLAVLALIGYAVARRLQGAPCTGTVATEVHGVLMYSVYLGMFANFFVQQYLKKKQRHAVGGTRRAPQLGDGNKSQRQAQKSKSRAAASSTPSRQGLRSRAAGC